jgi:hypothetical protein
MCSCRLRWKAENEVEARREIEVEAKAEVNVKQGASYLLHHKP